jgi:hypothetical protein
MFSLTFSLRYFRNESIISDVRLLRVFLLTFPMPSTLRCRAWPKSVEVKNNEGVTPLEPDAVALWLDLLKMYGAFPTLAKLEFAIMRVILLHASQTANLLPPAHVFHGVGHQTWPLLIV